MGCVAVKHYGIQLYTSGFQRGLFFPWDIWQGLETVLDVMTGEGSATGHLVNRPRDAAQHPTVYKTAPFTKNEPVQNGNSAEVETL